MPPVRLLRCAPQLGELGSDLPEAETFGMQVMPGADRLLLVIVSPWEAGSGYDANAARNLLSSQRAYTVVLRMLRCPRAVFTRARSLVFS